MSSTVGDKTSDDYLPNTRLLPGNNIGSSTNRLMTINCQNFYADTLNVARYLYAPELIIGTGNSLSGGPVALSTAAATVVTLPSQTGSGYAFIYKSDYSSTVFSPFFVLSASPYIQYADTTSTTENNVIQNTGTPTITLSGAVSGSNSIIRASLSSGTGNYYYKVFFVANYVSAV